MRSFAHYACLAGWNVLHLCAAFLHRYGSCLRRIRFGGCPCGASLCVDVVIERGVAAIDLIDFDYGYNNVFWHTPLDTVDKLSPHSLQIVGDVILETVRLLRSRS